ncbi:MAG: hypothetical protein Q8P18_04240 [Pseudomonadota bacterium]|nr:hypothetical protein [Pseudomonadota bacterium]
MLPPSTILRDAAIAGLLLSLAGTFAGAEFAGAVAAGALGSLVNLGLLIRLVAGASPEAGALFVARLFLKQIAGAVLLLLLVANLPAAPVFIGFCSVLLALAVRAALTLAGWASVPSHSTPEPG